ncbi:MAG: transcriptional regulator [Leptolyngbya sp. PLA1]|nr:transcriptional regulator [Leptolyngbya sp. PLA1]
MRPEHATTQRPEADDLSRVFKALASDTRRAMLDSLREGPRSTGDIVMQFPGLSRFAVMQHLKVLGRARLVVSRKEGRVRLHFLNVVPIQQVHERWVTRYESLWAGALTNLKRRAEVATARRRAVHPPLPGDSPTSRGARG